MSNNATVKVTISTTLIVNIEDWSTEFGTNTTATDVRRDVKSYFDANNLDIPEHLQDFVTIK